jgi:hypothetical protein
MDAMEFEEQARQDAEIRAFLEEVAGQAAPEMSEGPPQRFTLGGLEFAIPIVSYALYRYLKDFFDHHRALKETEVAGEQAKLIAVLIADGFPPKDAQAAAIALVNGVAARAEKKDPVLEKSLALFGKTV